MIDKKSILSKIMKEMSDKQSKPKYSSEADESMDEGYVVEIEGEEDMGAEMAAEDVLSAIDSKDPKALVSAMKALIEMCS